MIEINLILSVIKLICSVSYLLLLILFRNEEWTKFTRLILSFVLLVLNIITLWIGVQTGQTTAMLNISNIVIWTAICVMGIFRLRE